MEYPIRVLNVTTVLRAAGIEAFIMNMYRNIDRKNVQFDFMVMRNEKEFYDDEIQKLGGKKYTINMSVKNTFIKVLVESVELYRFLKLNSYNIVHIHATTPLRAFYILAAKKAGIPVRIYHSHSAFVPGKNRIKTLIYGMLKKKITKWATVYFACSDSAAEWMFEKKIYTNGTSDINFKVINNAINIDDYKYNSDTRRKIREEFGVPEDRIVLGHVGRMTEQKNAMFAIDIFEEFNKNLPNSELWLIGDGELKESILEKISEKGLNNKVILFGNRSDIGKMMQAMDCFVFPSLYEGLGIVLIEAQAAGLRVFTSDVMPPETKITDDIIYLSLKQNALSWAKILDENKSTFFERKDNSCKIKLAGYDIKEVSKCLEDFYITKSNL